jgi:hypothetical protein
MLALPAEPIKWPSDNRRLRRESAEQFCGGCTKISGFTPNLLNLLGLDEEALRLHFAAPDRLTGLLAGISPAGAASPWRMTRANQWRG